MLPFPASNALPHITYEADPNARTVKKNAIYYEKQQQKTKTKTTTKERYYEKQNKQKQKQNKLQKKKQKKNPANLRTKPLFQSTKQQQLNGENEM